ncbi:Uu.00g071080.m01.CDS01 [Anthostomella pinea]|uniref:Uu.00g071080.m01.CDS01 n=1 Tax=Anthostomella pinea TaxID=933095 RepID=A0AAI8VUU9_9PEZI|nr:Uu.00g071080.m01.CDS01 [Anthostomella pinea]
MGRHDPKGGFVSGGGGPSRPGGGKPPQAWTGQTPQAPSLLPSALPHDPRATQQSRLDAITGQNAHHGFNNELDIMQQYLADLNLSDETPVDTTNPQLTSYDALDKDFIETHDGEKPEMIIPESLKGFDSKETTAGTNEEEREQEEINRLAKHRWDREPYVQQRTIALRNALANPPESLNAPAATQHSYPIIERIFNAPILEPPQIEGFVVDLRALLLEYGKRNGGTLTLNLQRVTFFNASASPRAKAMLSLKDRDSLRKIYNNGTGGNNLMTFFAEDGPLTFHLVKIPDHATKTLQWWVWYDIQQPLVNIDGNAPDELRDNPPARVVMAMPAEMTTPGKWQKVRIAKKTEVLRELGARGEESDNPSQGTRGWDSTAVWTKGGLPPMQFSPEPACISRFIEEGGDDKFLGIPYMEAFPSEGKNGLTAPDMPFAHQRWWSTVRDEVSTQSKRWKDMVALMRTHSLGIKVMANEADYADWKAQERAWKPPQSLQDAPNLRAGPSSAKGKRSAQGSMLQRKTNIMRPGTKKLSQLRNEVLAGNVEPASSTGLPRGTRDSALSRPLTYDSPSSRGSSAGRGSPAGRGLSSSPAISSSPGSPAGRGASMTSEQQAANEGDGQKESSKRSLADSPSVTFPARKKKSEKDMQE